MTGSSGTVSCQSWADLVAEEEDSNRAPTASVDAAKCDVGAAEVPAASAFAYPPPPSYPTYAYGPDGSLYSVDSSFYGYGVIGEGGAGCYYTAEPASTCYCSACDREFRDSRSILQHLRDCWAHRGSAEAEEAANVLYYQDLAYTQQEQYASMMQGQYNTAEQYNGASNWCSAEVSGVECSTDDATDASAAMVAPPSDLYTASETGSYSHSQMGDVHAHVAPVTAPAPAPAPHGRSKGKHGKGQGQAHAAPPAPATPNKAGASASQGAGKGGKGGKKGGNGGSSNVANGHGPAAGNGHTNQPAVSGAKGKGKGGKGKGPAHQQQQPKSQVKHKPEEYDAAFPPLAGGKGGAPAASPGAAARRWIPSPSARKLRADAVEWAPAVTSPQPASAKSCDSIASCPLAPATPAAHGVMHEVGDHGLRADAPTFAPHATDAPLTGRDSRRTPESVVSHPILVDEVC